MLAVGIVRTFLISSVSVVVVALVLIGIAFWRISKRPKTGVSSSETNDSEYLIYSKRAMFYGYVMPFVLPQTISLSFWKLQQPASAHTLP